ncbi:MAG: helix-turn-helix domain-containing protein [Eubacteriales bacterium]
MRVAKTGRSVIEVAESFRPDIAFMDIQMPGINGIEAMKEIRTNNTSIIFIIMTAYDQFDYAKEALNLGVLEYLNKPVKQNRIIEVIHKAMELVDANRTKRHNDLQVKEKLEIVVPIIEHGFVSMGIYGEMMESEIANYKALLGIEETNQFTVVLEFGENLVHNQSSNPVGTGVRIQQNYEGIRAVVRQSYHCYVGPALGNRLNCLIPTSMKHGDYESRAREVERCHKIVQELERTFDVSCRMGIGSIQDFEHMRESFHDAIHALKSGRDKVVHCRDLPLFCEYEDDYPLHIEEELFEAIRLGKSGEASAKAEAFYIWMLGLRENYEQNIRLKSLEFVLFAEYAAYKNGGLVYRFGDRSDYIKTTSTADLDTELKDWFIEKITRAALNIATKKKEYTTDIIGKAKEYIQVHYSKDISLESISRKMDISPYYFSKLFKEVSGENFIEYVTQIRMDKAKELLSEGNATMKEICIEIGYGDPNYFSRIFKKNVGKTPTEYREGILND